MIETNSKKNPQPGGRTGLEPHPEDLGAIKLIGLGGTGGIVNSELVGRAIQLECNPSIAQPAGDRPTPTKPGGLSQPDIKVS